MSGTDRANLMRAAQTVINSYRNAWDMTDDAVLAFDDMRKAVTALVDAFARLEDAIDGMQEELEQADPVKPDVEWRTCPNCGYETVEVKGVAK